MTRNRKSGFGQAAQDIEDGLGGLFGALGEAIGDMVAKLEEGKTGTVERNHVFDSEKGPVRVHAGVRLRAGGIDAGAPVAAPKPVNPDRPRPDAKAAHEARPISYDMFEDDEVWVLTAELPGVSTSDLIIGGKDAVLEIRTTGKRVFEADVTLSDPFDLEGITRTLRNGILTLRIPKRSAA